ncbi:unnamed protein product [Ambrosiozyma monospora]|uniref:Unnamed protein product n=1 Tax=Ambrosiozyma monospora TaxID=43982 RepID=A0A9W7DHW6_AMBMO|nr:unnamed protein product [Ambrosiozyma monospora]
MICDLNVIYPVTDFTTRITEKDLTKLKCGLSTLEQLGYTHVALNFRYSPQLVKKIPNNVNELNPIDVTQLQEFKERLKIFTRITVIANDTSQFQHIAKFQQVFDLVTIEPTNEKVLQTAISNLDLDLISMDMANRLPCYMKHKTVCSAVEKGIYFEFKYNDLINSSTRSMTISNIKQLIRASRSRGMVCSSGLDIDHLHFVRSYHDVVNLLCVIGLDNARASQLFKDWSSKVLLNGRLRVKSFKQTVVISGDDGLIDNRLETSVSAESKPGVSNTKMDASGYTHEKRKLDLLEREKAKLEAKKQKL